MCYSADYLVIFWLQCHCSDELRGIKPADEGLQLQVDTGLLTQVGWICCRFSSILEEAIAAEAVVLGPVALLRFN